MNSRRLKIFVAFLCVVISVNSGILYAQNISYANLNDIIPQKYLEQLKSEGSVQYIYDQDTSTLRLLPNSTYSSTILNNRTESTKKQQRYVTESLYLVSKSTLIENSKNPGKAAVSMETIAKVMRSISSMEGMTYYSFSEKKRLVLYDSSYMFASPENRAPIADQNTGNADGQISYAFHNDNSFGKCYYRLNYYQTENEMAAIFTNIDALKFLGIKAVENEHLKINIIIADCGEDIVVYICTDALCAKVPFVKNRLTDSFRARVNAIYDWFITQF